MTTTTSQSMTRAIVTIGSGQPHGTKRSIAVVIIAIIITIIIIIIIIIAAAAAAALVCAPI
jgi:hypothetical protein